jgi:hypothetical protein
MITQTPSGIPKTNVLEFRTHSPASHLKIRSRRYTDSWFSVVFRRTTTVNDNPCCVWYLKNECTCSLFSAVAGVPCSGAFAAVITCHSSVGMITDEIRPSILESLSLMPTIIYTFHRQLLH